MENKREKKEAPYERNHNWKLFGVIRDKFA